MKDLIIFGASGFGREVACLVKSLVGHIIVSLVNQFVPLRDKVIKRAT